MRGGGLSNICASHRKTVRACRRAGAQAGRQEEAVQYTAGNRGVDTENGMHARGGWGHQLALTANRMCNA